MKAQHNCRQQQTAREQEIALDEFVLEKTKNPEYIPSPASLRSVSQSSDDEDNVPILATLKTKDNVPIILATLQPKDNVSPVVERYSSDSEGDEVPISQTIQAVSDSDMRGSSRGRGCSWCGRS